MSIVIPSYRRPERLRECLEGITHSTTRPHEVVVAVRRSDPGSSQVARSTTPEAIVVEVDRAGVVAAMRAGAERATGDIILFLDDDAVLGRDWLSHAIPHFARPLVGGVGGRDVVTDPDSPVRMPVAGVFTRFGKMIGNHHLVAGPARPVDVLKGANMAFRREALALPVGLLGEGAEVHNEVAISLSARRAGWQLILDPAAEVLHLPGVRHDDDRRVTPSLSACHRAAFNLTWVILSLRPAYGVICLVYGLLIGDRQTPGVARWLLGIGRGEGYVVQRLLPSVSGQLRGALRVVRGQRIEMAPLSRTGLRET